MGNDGDLWEINHSAVSQMAVVAVFKFQIH